MTATQTENNVGPPELGKLRTVASWSRADDFSNKWSSTVGKVTLCVSDFTNSGLWTPWLTVRLVTGVDWTLWHDLKTKYPVIEDAMYAAEAAALKIAKEILEALGSE